MAARAMTKGADTTGSCLDTELKKMGVTDFDSASMAQHDKAFETCDKQAMQAFQKAGGSVDDFEMAMAAGAMTKGADQMGKCVDTELKKINITNFNKASMAQQDAAFEKCDSTAMLAFEKAGGVRPPLRASQQLTRYATCRLETELSFAPSCLRCIGARIIVGVCAC